MGHDRGGGETRCLRGQDLVKVEDSLDLVAKWADLILENLDGRDRLPAIATQWPGVNRRSIPPVYTRRHPDIQPQTPQLRRWDMFDKQRGRRALRGAEGCRQPPDWTAAHFCSVSSRWRLMWMKVAASMELCKTASCARLKHKPRLAQAGNESVRSGRRERWEAHLLAELGDADAMLREKGLHEEAASARQRHSSGRILDRGNRAPLIS